MDDDGRDKSRRRLASRIVYASFLVLVVAFILSSALQIVSAVFGWGSERMATTAAATPTTRACGDGVARLSSALERAFAAAMREDDDATALRVFEEARRPEWTDATAADVERSCAAAPHGTDAFAALMRLNLTEEAFVRRQVVEVAPLRRDVAAYLPQERVLR